jgi:hypothetical protein
LYNKIGIIKNPNALVSANLATGTIAEGSAYTLNTFNQLLIANVSPEPGLNNGDVVIGVTSGARGKVAFANSTQLQLTGDKYFIDGESIANSAGVTLATISINQLGAIYTKDLKPIYVDNINNVERANNQTETYKLTIEI